MLAQLAVFAGGIALEAAEAVIDPASPAGDIWVPDLLQALVEKSLLRRVAAQRLSDCSDQTEANAEEQKLCLSDAS